MKSKTLNKVNDLDLIYDELSAIDIYNWLCEKQYDMMKTAEETFDETEGLLTTDPDDLTIEELQDSTEKIQSSFGVIESCEREFNMIQALKDKVKEILKDIRKELTNRNIENLKVKEKKYSSSVLKNTEIEYFEYEDENIQREIGVSFYNDLETKN